MTRDLLLARWFGGVLALLTITSALSPACAPPDFTFDLRSDAALPDSCLNQILDEGELDVDCGGECPRCGLGQACESAGDCREGDCIDFYCQDASCSDLVLGGEESDVDCGGARCKPCPAQSACNVHEDCASSVCSGGLCAAPSCTDLTLNGDESDADCGGGCPQCLPGRVCRSGADCVGGICGVDQRCVISCIEGRFDCDGDPENGCEANLKTSADHCGECGKACTLAHAEAGCSGGSCFVQECEAPFLACNDDEADGCEVNGSTDPGNCGECGKICPAVNGVPSCVNAQCAIECEEGYDDCDDDPSNGCEKKLSDVNNCGECGKICPATDGGTPWCVDGKCGVTICPAGFGDCNATMGDGPLGDGCETDLRSDTNSCNGCNSICVAANGAPACEEGACLIESCNPSYADCDDSYQTGCEANTEADLAHCGACDSPCSIENASAECSGGQCEVKTCTFPFLDCDGDDVDCERNQLADPANCGGCAGDGGLDCSAVFSPLHATGQCLDGGCDVDECFTNYGNCNAQSNDGCEADFRTDSNHCGLCERECLDVNAENACVAGACKPTCDAGYLSCDGDPIDGCEINKQTNDAHCGACDNACADEGGGNSCKSGVCAPSCDSTHGDCDASRANGCETIIQDNDAHCGGCDNACQDQGGTNACSGKVCAPVCEPGYGDCDASRLNGCEADLELDESHCGECGIVCQSGETVHTSSSSCNAGTCEPVCESGYAACGAPEDGCTASLDLPAHCGDCDTSCSGDAPFCVSRACAARLPIVRENASTSGSGVPSGGSISLKLKHALANPAGKHRLVVVTVATKANGTTEGTPDHVAYGGSSLDLAGSQAITRWSGNQVLAGLYFFKDADLPEQPGTYDVSVTMNGAQSGARLVMSVMEFSGVEQGTFLAAQSGTTHEACNTSPPGSTLSIATAGSFILSSAAVYNDSTISGAPNGVPLGPTETLELYLGGVLGLAGSVKTTGTGSHSVGWTVPSCNKSVHLAVALDPAHTP